MPGDVTEKAWQVLGGQHRTEGLQNCQGPCELLGWVGALPRTPGSQLKALGKLFLPTSALDTRDSKSTCELPS